MATKKILFLQLVSYENVNTFFQYFHFKSHSCGYERTKAFTEHYGRDDLQKWSQNISQQNAKWLYIAIKFFGRTFIFHNPRLFPWKEAIILS